ncbi:MAG TPA: CBS domain-containing protein [Candidatus Limnocylindrales bacterium]
MTDATWISDFESLRVADVMTIDPVVARMDDTLETAEQLLTTFRISGLPVVDPEGRLVGVISQTDLVPGGATLRSLLHRNGGHLRVGELMTAPAIAVGMDTTLADAARLMHERQIHRLVAVDGRARPIGVLSASDFVTVIAEG